MAFTQEMEPVKITPLPRAEIISIDEPDQENFVCEEEEVDIPEDNNKGVPATTATFIAEPHIILAADEARGSFLQSVNVNKTNFEEKIAELHTKLNTAACVVLDLEFSGLRRNNFSRPRIFDEGAERYKRLQQVVKYYKPLQVGIAIVQDTTTCNSNNNIPVANVSSGGGSAHVDVYSCFLSGGDASRILAVCAPATAGDDEKEQQSSYPGVTFEHTAAEFLIGTGFQLDDVFRYGVQYINNEQERRLREILADKQTMFSRLHFAGLFYAERYGDGPRELRACLARIRIWLTKKRERQETKRREQHQREFALNNDGGGCFRVGGFGTDKTTNDNNTASWSNRLPLSSSNLPFTPNNTTQNGENDDEMNDGDTYTLKHCFSTLPSYLYLHEAIRMEFGQQLWTAPIGFDLSRILVFDRRPITAASSFPPHASAGPLSVDQMRRSSFSSSAGTDERSSMHQSQAADFKLNTNENTNEKKIVLDELGEWAVEYCLGFTRIFRAIVDTCQRRRIPLVAHNCLTDLLYFYQHFYKPLPDDYVTFKASLHELFPIIIDTKALFRQYHPLLMSTLPSYTVTRKEARVNVELRDIFLKTMEYSTLAFPVLTCDAADLTDYKLAPQLAAMLAHNAAFDALMTSVVYVRLGRRMWIEAQLQQQKAIENVVAQPKTPLTPISPALSTVSSTNSASAARPIDVNWRSPVPLAEYPPALNDIINRILLPHAALDYIKLDGPDPVSTRFSLALVLHMKRAPLFLLQTDDEYNNVGNASDDLAVDMPVVKARTEPQQQNGLNSRFAAAFMPETFEVRRQRRCEIDIVTREEYIPLGNNRWLVLFSREDDYLRFRMRRRADEIVESHVQILKPGEIESVKPLPNLLPLPPSRHQPRRDMLKQNNGVVIGEGGKVQERRVTLDASQSSIQVCELDEWLAKAQGLGNFQHAAPIAVNGKLVDEVRHVDDDEKVLLRGVGVLAHPFAPVKWVFVGSVLLANCFAWQWALKNVIFAKR